MRRKEMRERGDGGTDGQETMREAVDVSFENRVEVGIDDGGVAAGDDFHQGDWRGARG